MSFWSELKVFGTDVEKIFSWFGSPKGQTVVATGESFLEAAIPASTPIVDLFNTWAQKAYTVEALAVAAGQSTGTGADKAVLAISTITPTVLQYAQQAGVSPRTTAQIQAANDAAVAFIKAMTDPAPVAVAATASHTVPQPAAATVAAARPVVPAPIGAK